MVFLGNNSDHVEMSQLSLFYLPAFDGTEPVIDWYLVTGFDLGTNELLFRRYIKSDYKKNQDAEMRRLRNSMRGWSSRQTTGSCR